MSFKTKELPYKFYITFDGDEEIYDGVVVDITDIDEEKDSCVLVVEDLMPRTTRLVVPYTSLDQMSVDCGAGARIYIDKPERTA